MAIIFSPRCGHWDCPECATANVGYWRMVAIHGCRVLAEAGHQLFFATVTSHERLTTPQATVRVFKSAWPRLRRRMWGKTAGMAFFGVPEAHKSGRLHFHFLTQAGTTKRWLKDNARQCGLGYIADVQELGDPVGGAFYVTKYLTKSLEYNGWPDSFRRVRLSQNWPRPPELKASEDWTFRPLLRSESMADIAAEFAQLRYRVELTDHRTAWAIVDSVP